MRAFDNLERAGALGSRVNTRMCPGAALRRAVAKFPGLLGIGRNRKEPYSKLLLQSGRFKHWTLPEKTALIIRRLIVSLTVAVVTFHAGQGFTQGAFPAPLPGQAARAALRHFRR